MATFALLSLELDKWPVVKCPVPPKGVQTPNVNLLAGAKGVRVSSFYFLTEKYMVLRGKKP